MQEQGSAARAGAGSILEGNVSFRKRKVNVKVIDGCKRLEKIDERNREDLRSR